jgi:primosomal protein N' (replication factor Y)
VADVALPVPVRRTFAYRIPAELRDSVRAGCRVNVPFGARILTGFVVGFDPADAPAELRAVRSVVDPQPLVDGDLLELTRWIAERTLCSWGEALRAALPGHAPPRRERVFSLTRPPEADLFGQSEERLEDRILSAVGAAERIALPPLARSLGLRAADLRDEVDRLVRAGKLRRSERVAASAPGGAQRVKVVRIRRRESGEEPDLSRAPVQARCLELLDEAGGELPLRDLADAVAGSRGAVKRLAEKRIVEVRLRAWEGRAPEPGRVRIRIPELNEAQAAAVGEIESALRAGRPSTFLLHGVTGSGKTEVYLRAMAEARRLGRRSILLVPEITLTPQTVSRLRGRFGGRAAVVHSRMQDAERRRIWHGARTGDYDVVLGPRSAIFAPLPDLGLVVLDEEHDGAYKQEDAPRYHARDVAMERARACGGTVVLGSATPDVETWLRAESGEMQLLRLPRRVARLPLPAVRLVDLRNTKGNFSQELLDAIQVRLERKEQVILFLNRRGFAPFVQCSACGAAVRCDRCAVTLTFHRTDGRVRCHYCDAERGMPEQCPECRARRMVLRGAGTQRIEDDLLTHFPEMRLGRLDSDSVKRAGAHEEILSRFLEGELDVLLGTQMVAKGLDFPRVTLVGVINADTGIHLPDYRATERTFQLLTQVAGRAGRSELGGEVLIQTRCPDHPCLLAARDHDDGAFRATVIPERRELRYPPFAKLASILVRGPSLPEAEQAAERIRKRIEETVAELPGRVDVLGPAPAPLAQIRGKHRIRLLLKGDRRVDVRVAAARALDPLPAGGRTDVQVDVDPLDML